MNTKYRINNCSSTRTFQIPLGFREALFTKSKPQGNGTGSTSVTYLHTLCLSCLACSPQRQSPVPNWAATASCHLRLAFECHRSSLGRCPLAMPVSGFLGSMDKESSFRLLDAYFEAGGNFIDTANNYQNEQSEAWLGEWMAARQNRDRLVIATKYTTDYKQYELGKGNAINHCGNHRRSLHMTYGIHSGSCRRTGSTSSTCTGGTT